MTGRRCAFPLVFPFDETPDGCDPRIRGSKGAGLARMHGLGLPIPPGFTISTAVARASLAFGGRLPRRLSRHLDGAMAALESATARRFGDPAAPLLVAVRSGASRSMPGMMDTVLNVGLNRAILDRLGRDRGWSFAFDCYRRFLEMYGTIVLGLDPGRFGSPAPDAATCDRYRAIIEAATGEPVPEDPRHQLDRAIGAVIRSWNNPRARLFRTANGIPDRLGTAITVQAMVFGNLGQESGTGVVFSRNPDTGKPGLCGEFLANAQGEDVVSGVATPLPVAVLHARLRAVFAELDYHAATLERHFGDVVEIEFTVEQGRLYLLQCRPAPAAPEAVATVAVHEVCRRRLTRRQAVARLSPDRIARLDRGRALREEDVQRALAGSLIGRGLAASPGACAGRVALTPAAATGLAGTGDPVVLVRPDTSAEDFAGLLAAAAVVTAAGGATSHAAIVARDLGIPAVVGVAGANPDASPFDGLAEGDWISVDGTRGLVLRGRLPTVAVRLRREVRLFLHWARRFRPAAPEPRISAGWAGDRFGINGLLADVYLSEAMASAAADGALRDEAQELRREIHGRCAGVFACYLALAVIMELNQSEAYGAALHQAPEAVARLDAEFGAFAGSHRAAELLAWLAALPRDRQIAFFGLVATVFERGWWEPGYGGRAWGVIARTAEAYLAGRITPTVFVDRVFHLRHHGRRLFDKHPMVRNAASDETVLQAQLDAKRDARSIEALFATACRSGPGGGPEFGPSPPVMALWQRGLALGLWCPPVPDGAAGSDIRVRGRVLP